MLTKKWTMFLSKTCLTQYPEKGKYAGAFTAHEEKGRIANETLDQWKQALQEVSYIRGIEFHRSDGNLGKQYKDIVDTVFDKVREARNEFKLEVAEHPVGLDEAIQELEAKIFAIGDSENGYSKIVGIVGRAGVGKTTLAKEFYNRKHSMFCRSSFLFDIGEAHRNKNMVKMQDKLMCDLKIASATFEPSSSKEGIGVEMIKYQLKRWYSKPLIILDGVNHADQLEALALNELLEIGALILVTCCDTSVLQSFEMVQFYEVRELDSKYGRQLFCLHAFGQSNPPNGREKLVETILNFLDGLPLHLKDMGQQFLSMQNDLHAKP